MTTAGFDEIAMFRAIAESGARALLIGRQALIALGMPVMTADYDFWLPQTMRRSSMLPSVSFT